jgi:hypothetical protein
MRVTRIFPNTLLLLTSSRFKGLRLEDRSKPTTGRAAVNVFIGSRLRMLSFVSSGDRDCQDNLAAAPEAPCDCDVFLKARQLLAVSAVHMFEGGRIRKMV